MTASLVRDKFSATRREMASALIERDAEIDLCLTALICQEHCLLVGPPGTGKSLLLDSLIRWMGGGAFSALFTKFTTPEEVFGPVSVIGLKADRYQRITTGKLPEADFAFLDEVWKASSAILNTLLRILNERAYDNGDGTFRVVPLKLCVAASNEWPNGENGGRELAAMFDRFLFRKSVHPIRSFPARQRLFWGGSCEPALSTTLSTAELQVATAEAAKLPWSDDGKAAFEAIVAQLALEGIRPGDRRQRKAIKAAQAYAWLEGAADVQPDHLEPLAHVLWDDPIEQPQKAAEVVAKIANPVGLAVNSLLIEAEQIIAATNVKDLTQAATCASKLGEIEKALGKVAGGNGRAKTAREYVKGQIKRVRLATIESV